MNNFHLGRDHGVPSYNDARKACGLSTFNTWEELAQILSPSDVELLKKEYYLVEDVELQVGASLEAFNQLGSKLLGDTFSCIAKEQFRKFVKADAYGVESSVNPHPFSAAQISAIKSFNINRLVCSNSDVEQVPQNGFEVPSDSNPLSPCSGHPEIDLSAFTNIH